MSTARRKFVQIKKRAKQMLDSNDIKIVQKFTDGSLHPRGVCYDATNDRAKN